MPLEVEGKEKVLAVGEICQVATHLRSMDSIGS